MKILHYFMIVGIIVISSVLFSSTVAYGDNSFTTSRATDNNSLVVRFTAENTHQYVGKESRMDLGFVQIGTHNTLVKNVDYKINIYYNNTLPQQQSLVYSSPLNHTLDGKASILYMFPKSGFYLVGVYVDKIFGMNIHEESVFFDINMLNMPNSNLSPYKQVQYGILPYKVSCKEGLELFIKIKDSAPACIRSQTEPFLKSRNWGYPAGIDIILDKPSDITKSAYRLDPANEKIVREKQKILEDTLMSRESQSGGFQNRTANLPWSSIGYDTVDHALEVTIIPDFFNTSNLPGYFQKIRSIVGYEINVALSPMPYPTPL